MKYSIQKQLTLIFVGLLLTTILACILTDNIFLEQYYIRNKQQSLIRVYEAINNAANADELQSDSFDIEFQRVCGKYNVNVIVLGEDAVILKASDHNPDILRRLLWDSLLGANGRSEVMAETEDYTIEMQEDARTHTEYIQMWGALDNGNVFLMRTAVESIQESSEIANRFLLYVGLIAMLVSAVIIFFVSRKITRPILELADISDRMGRLDFEARYSGKDRNEIAVLGENINRLSNALERTISELKTANNELQNDIEKKEQIDEMRKEFLANVSHELKTPIALIQGYAEGLKEGVTQDPESTAFYCDVIVDEATKMNQMVKKLLTLNQLEFGNDAVTMERFDIASMIRNFLQSAELLARQSNISIRYVQVEPVYVWGDEFKIEEVFSNYFSNAMNHCEGEKLIDIKLEKIDGGKLRVTVFNTGERIPEESITHIWEKFYKVDKARTREYGGSGVGLSIVSAIMESMNQRYGVDNYENGVAFWFELEAQ